MTRTDGVSEAPAPKASRDEFERVFRIIEPSLTLARNGDDYVHLKAHTAWLRWQENAADGVPVAPAALDVLALARKHGAEQGGGHYFGTGALERFALDLLAACGVEGRKP